MSENTLSHNDVRNQIAIFLSDRGFLTMFNNALVGRALTDDRILKANGDGRSDLQAIEPGNGRYWAIEVKIGKDTLKRKQKIFREQVEKRGGVFIEAHSLEDIIINYNKYRA